MSKFNDIMNKTESEDDGFVNGKPTEPFGRKRRSTMKEPELIKEIFDTLKTLGEEDDLVTPELKAANGLTKEFIQNSSDIFALRWKSKDELSEVAFKGILLVLEHCLSNELANMESFEHFVSALGFHTVFFWKKAVPVLYDSDMQYGTGYREALLFSLTLYDVNNGHNRLRELFAAVPGLRDSLLGKHAKKFQEAFHHMFQRRLSWSQPSSCRASEADLGDLQNLDDLENDLPTSEHSFSNSENSRRHSFTRRGDSGVNSDDAAAAQLETVHETRVLEAPADQAKGKEERNGASRNKTEVGSALGALTEEAEVEENGERRKSESSGYAADMSDVPDTIISGGLSKGQFQVGAPPYLALFGCTCIHVSRPSSSYVYPNIYLLFSDNSP